MKALPLACPVAEDAEEGLGGGAGEEQTRPSLEDPLVRVQDRNPSRPQYRGTSPSEIGQTPQAPAVRVALAVLRPLHLRVSAGPDAVAALTWRAGSGFPVLRFGVRERRMPRRRPGSGPAARSFPRPVTRPACCFCSDAQAWSAPVRSVYSPGYHHGPLVLEVACLLREQMGCESGPLLSFYSKLILFYRKTIRLLTCLQKYPLPSERLPFIENLADLQKKHNFGKAR